MASRGTRRPVTLSKNVAQPRAISIILATREDSEEVARRVANLRSYDYPRELLHVIVSLDRSVAGRADAFRGALEGPVTVAIES